MYKNILLFFYLAINSLLVTANEKIAPMRDSITNLSSDEVLCQKAVESYIKEVIELFHQPCKHQACKDEALFKKAIALHIQAAKEELIKKIREEKEQNNVTCFHPSIWIEFGSYQYLKQLETLGHVTIIILQVYNKMAGKNGKTAMDLARKNADRLHDTNSLGNTSDMAINPANILNIWFDNYFIKEIVDRIRHSSEIAMIYYNDKIKWYKDFHKHKLPATKYKYFHSYIADILTTAMFLAAQEENKKAKNN